MIYVIPPGDKQPEKEAEMESPSKYLIVGPDGAQFKPGLTSNTAFLD